MTEKNDKNISSLKPTLISVGSGITVIVLSLPLFPLQDIITTNLQNTQNLKLLVALIPVGLLILTVLISFLIYLYYENKKLKTRASKLQNKFDKCDDNLTFWRNMGKDLVESKDNPEELRLKAQKYAKEIKNRNKRK